ncbi:Poly(A) polymeras-like protein [Amylocarpus encephaloides]|uniref:Poly(A) polymerase n=1 Tax=Amylocarpus encephaloides TaxID=45428 RepID=A0A9P7YN65_9HELO|nr:Poly(A) polymeras-like protein [Amylocarpus encephaloides]
MAAPAQLGMTPPLSTALPTESDISATNALIEELKRQNNYESSADSEKRTVVLQSLQRITEEFVKQVLIAQGQPGKIATAAGGKIFTYGSYRLGVYGPGSDIDTLVVAPKDVTLDHFFAYFPDLLMKMAPAGAITELTPVPDSFVPIIKFEYSGISIDLIFCHVQLSQIPKDLSLLGMDMLRGLDEKELRCLNGTRVTDEILTLVPQKAVFRTALRGIKLWAQRRAIYANIMGFPGGVAWAMMVARVCQLYPKAAGSTILLKFFRIMEKWTWPTPVQLKKIENGPFSNIRTWNPQLYHGDKNHLMPIITPAYPSMCATHNITRSTRTIIQRELQRGGDIMTNIMEGRTQWKELFVKNTFFVNGYKYYLSIIAASTTEEAQLIWSGFVESKVRLLMGFLEDHGSIAIAHPFNKGFERKHKCHSEEEVEKAKSCLHHQVKDASTAGESIQNGDEKPNGTENRTTVYTSTWYIGLELSEGAKSLDLSYQVDKFKHDICMKWEKFDQDLNAINIIHTKNCDLPVDVFCEGEVKPTRPQKKKKRSAEDPANLPAKRQHTSVAAAS